MNAQSSLRRIRSWVRGVVPVRWYPVLARPYRWWRRGAIRRLERRDRAYRRTHPDVLAPPAKLRFKVVGPCTIEQFSAGGHRTVDDLERGLREAGVAIERIGTALDFGCGCGRTLLAARRRWAHVRLSGSDVDAEAVAWCQANVPGIDFAANAPLPPLPYPDAHFDLVWAISVFTHLDEGRQDRWLAELRRIVRPGGVVLASVHGLRAWGGLPRRTVARVRERGFVFTTTAADRGLHPDWYQTAWHTEDYIRRHWSSYFEVHGYLPRGPNSVQDLVVMKAQTED